MDPVKQKRERHVRHRLSDIDLSLIQSNLRLSVWERILQHSRALETACLLREAMKKRRRRSRSRHAW